MRHAFIAGLLGIRNIAVIVNKMDLMGLREDVFHNVRQQFEPLAQRLEAVNFYFVPVVALDGDDIAVAALA